MSIWLLGILLSGVSVGLSLGGLFWVRRIVAVSVLQKQHDVAGFMIAIVSVIYAVLLAFVVLVVWEQFEDTKTIVVQEAGAVGDLFRLAHGLPAPARDKARSQMKAYVHSVINEEWDAMSEGRANPNTAEAEDSLWETYEEMSLRTTRESALYSQSLERLTIINDKRQQRLLASRSGVPRVLWFVLVLSGCITLSYTYFFGVEDIRIQAVMIALLAITIALVLLVIIALDYPFSGETCVSPEAFVSVLNRMATVEQHEKKFHAHPTKLP